MNERRRVLIVDDTPENLKVLGTLLKGEGYDVRVATNGPQALEAARKQLPDLILLDVMMPGMNGYEVCHALKAESALAEIPVIFISALASGDQKVTAFKEGAVDYVTKPFYAEEVIARVRTNVENSLYRHRLEDLIQLRTRQLFLTQEATIASMAILAEYRDQETGGHIQRTKLYVRELAVEVNRVRNLNIGDEEIDLMQQCAPLHDIGKVGIPDAILHKPGPLTAEEFAVMREHPTIGARVISRTMEILGPNSFLTYARELTEGHHEKWDGSGYPQGRAGEDIPLSARIMAVADVYDALRSRRAYKEPMGHEEALRVLTEGDGRTVPAHFDPQVLRALAAIQGTIRDISVKYGD